MANETENALKNIAAKIAGYVDDAATMTVETRFVQFSASGEANFDQARPAARTIIKLDGDSEVVVPAREGSQGRMELDTALFDLHQRNVATAIEYRSRLLNSLLSALQSARR